MFTPIRIADLLISGWIFIIYIVAQYIASRDTWLMCHGMVTLNLIVLSV